jgi:hypothetical protein
MDRRILLGVGVVALAVVLFLVLRPEDTENTSAETPTSGATTESTTTTETETSETTTETETSETTPETEPPPGRTRVAVAFRNGRVIGGVKRVTVERGDRVVLVVRSDEADHVHLHGYDLLVDVVPGGVARIRFTADLVGRFEIELEDRHLPLAELEVEP